MNAYHLRKTEVIYELKIRNVDTDGNANELRKRLTQCFSADTQVDETVVNSLDADAELEECEGKYQDLSSLVSDYEGTNNDNEFHRIVARLWHLYLRVERIPIGASSDSEQAESKEKLLSRSKELLDSFRGTSDSKNQPDPRTSAVSTASTTRGWSEATWKQEEGRLQEARRQQEEKWKLEEVRLRGPQQRTEERIPHEDLRGQERRGPPEDDYLPRFSLTRNDTGASSRPRYVPVYKWGLKFDNSGPSIAAFLERVEELRRARGVTHQELYESAVDLFAGSALVWYRAASIRIQSWHQLTRELKEVFQPADYDIRFHQEIFNRLQGDNEPIDLYIAAMEGLYGRLAVAVPEPTRLAQIYNNLHPQLQDRLALCSIQTLEQLRSMGRRAEAGRLSMVRIRHATTRENTLEPDLAYHDQNHPRKPLSGRVASVQSANSDRQDPVCWNCGDKGHRFRFCSKPKRRFCFGCGKEDVFKRDCVKCCSKKRARQGVRKEVGGSGSLNTETIPAINYVIHSQQEDHRPYLKVRVFGREVTALLDSGASQTFLGGHGMWILNQFPARLQSVSGRFVETADSTRHEVQGFVNLPITLQGRTKSLKVCIVPSLQHTLILGIDFWEIMHIVADMRNRKWDFATKSVYLFCGYVEGITSEDNLTLAERKRLQDLLEEHFEDEPSTLGRTDRVKHVIDTGGVPPIKQRYYNVSPARQKLINEELDHMLQLGVVEPSQSAWSSPIMLLDKPDGSKRFVVDFRAVNAVSRKDAYPLPQVTAILDRLRDARFLSSLDIKSAYWQIELDEASKEKTAFAIPGRGLYQFVTMPFGLCGAPATWQRFVDTVLGPELEPNVFVYLDDIIVVTSTFESHLKTLKEIFRRVREAKLTLNREKCKFCRRELKYLGYIVSGEGLRVDPEKVKAIVDIPIPRNQKEVRQFTGMASWYRRFIPNFASRMTPLTSLLKRRNQFEWTPEAEMAFQDVKSCLISAPILSCPDFSKPFTISCDASGVGIGAVLSQDSEQGESVVAYASRTLTRQEQNFSATERECLAVIFAVEKFRPYVEGTRFTVVTDHYSLLWLSNLKDPTGRLAR
ncbi:uncharacterized protein LOC124361140 [Homalodisca vitripennis]|uniref:uncharacterized protein LOC124361140 n=1 Tax=Homalodisca vitripennis TaxID=197043 RepID=UPI001EEB9BE1|nr:uncharacterized protein LOC124361140 [Homalodisca vitripennis]